MKKKKTEGGWEGPKCYKPLPHAGNLLLLWFFFFLFLLCNSFPANVLFYKMEKISTFIA
jgi:hypothetical protein